MLVRAVLGFFFAAVCRVCAQEALSDALPSPASATEQPVPDSAWLDLRQNAPQNSKAQNAPAWIEALTLLPGQATEGAPAPKSVFRIRVTQPSPDYRVLFFRLFFDDKPDQQPELIAWDAEFRFCAHPDDRRFIHRYRSSRRWKNSARSVFGLDDEQ